MKFAHRFAGPGKPYDGLTTIRRGRVDWSGQARFIPNALGEPMGWRKPQRIFVNSMSDLFHHSVTNDEIAAVFGVMAACPQHTFQILTKRPERMLEWFAWHKAQTEVDGEPWIPIMREAYSSLPPKFAETIMEGGRARDGVRALEPWPLPNLWLGVSTENQETADERIPLLLKCPAAVHFVSAEPLLGPIEFGLHLSGIKMADGSRWTGTLPLLNWVIVGGESGPGARPCNIDWIESVVRQCREASVPCFVKQLGSKPLIIGWDGIDAPLDRKREGKPVVHLLHDRKGGAPWEWPEWARVREFPEVQDVR